MPNPSHPDMLLVEQIRAGKPDAWDSLIAQYEGRLLSFVDSRLHRRASSEDVVQETFIGFLTSLPNYDTRRPLESYLFSIAAHKLTDYLRREGRRPALPEPHGLRAMLNSTNGAWCPRLMGSGCWAGPVGLANPTGRHAGRVPPDERRYGPGAPPGMRQPSVPTRGLTPSHGRSPLRCISPVHPASR